MHWCDGCYRKNLAHMVGKKIFLNGNKQTPNASAAEERNKNKMQNLGRSSIKIWTKSWNCAEISSDWGIAQNMKQWMHAWISFHVIFFNTVQDFKTNEPLTKKKLSFLFLLKSCENADMAFCILADDVYRYVLYQLDFEYYNWATSWKKPVYAIGEQQRHRSAWAFAQSDQCLCCLLHR